MKLIEVNKTKLLIVYPSLDQAGSQRWIYEICKHIDKDKFEVAVLTGEKYLNSGDEYTFENYYYQELKRINIPLFEYISKKKKKTLWHRGINKIQRGIYKILNKETIKTNPKIIKLLESFDVVCLVDIHGYGPVQSEISKLNLNNFFIVLHSHKVQFSYDPYNILDKNKSYNFAYFCPKQIEELSESGFDEQNNRFFHNPLVLNLSDYPNLFNPVTENLVVISVFTRISKQKQIDVFIKAFEQLQKRLSRRCVLNIYGKIVHQDYYEDIQQLIKSSEIIEDTVCFMGHTHDIAATIIKDKINMYWGTTLDTSVGYSSIEVGAMGVPSILWNENSETTAAYPEEQTNGSMIAPNRIDDFVERNLNYLESDESLEELSIKQREYFIKTHNVTDKIIDFENYVVSMKY